MAARLAEIWHHDDGQPRYALPVTCRIAAGRHEDQYYAALGIVCKGPIGAFTPPQMYDANADGIKETFVGSTLDGQMNHGFKTDDNGNTKQPPTYPTENPLLGLRQTLGTDPAGAHDYFSLGRVSETGAGWFQQPSDNSWMHEVAYAHSAYNEVFAAGVALCEIRITQVKDAPFTSPGQHTMVACISQGRTGWIWTAPETRTTAPGCTNPFWVAINTYLGAIGLLGAEYDTQEASFDSPAAIAAAAIADTTVDRIIGTGTETQFRFKGSIDDRKPTRDWLQAVLNSGVRLLHLVVWKAQGRVPQQRQCGCCVHLGQHAVRLAAPQPDHAPVRKAHGVVCRPGVSVPGQHHRLHRPGPRGAQQPKREPVGRPVRRLRLLDQVSGRQDRRRPRARGAGRHDAGGAGCGADRLLEDDDPGARDRSRDGGERGGPRCARRDRKLPHPAVVTQRRLVDQHPGTECDRPACTT